MTFAVNWIEVVLGKVDEVVRIDVVHEAVHDVALQEQRQLWRILQRELPNQQVEAIFGWSRENLTGTLAGRKGLEWRCYM